MKKNALKSLVVSLVAIGAIASAEACTSFTLPTTDGSYVYGRTMEFGVDLQSAIAVFPRGETYQGTGPDGKEGSGLSWTGRYAVVGMNALGHPVVVDGMNDVGLTGGLLNAPNTAVYQNVTERESTKSIAPFELLTYVLSNFATVDEARHGLSSVLVNSASPTGYDGKIKVRMTLHDRSGKSIVVEYLKGELVITDNPTGVMTNDPPFAWHLDNLGNYANLTPVEKDPLVINGTAFAPPSSGSGLHGLPGDSLSPSRFVRAVAFTQAAPKDLADTQVNTAWHILGNFDIPPGSIQLPNTNPYGGGAGGFERTEWSTVANARSLVYYVKTFDNPTIQSYDLKKVTESAKGRVFIPLENEPRIIELN